MAKNIIICCDGTNNEYKVPFTNVLKLHNLLRRPTMEQRELPEQIIYYDPGVGTLSWPWALTWLARKISILLGLAFGVGILQNVQDAYTFLMKTYEPGDRIYIFGFSRGAYTARALAAMLYKVGLLRPGRENMLPYALKMFQNERDPRTYVGFKATFGRSCPVHFLGLWDTVKSVGWIYNPLSLPFTTRNPKVSVVRHAISIDERRCFYRQNLWGKPYKNQDVLQVWFAGVHCDVGGGYPEAESGLSKITLKWMVEEAIQHGLLVDQNEVVQVLRQEDRERVLEKIHDQKNAKVFHCPPDYRGPLHQSLKRLWWIAEVIPKRYKDFHDHFKTKWMIPLGRRRYINNGVNIHVTVVQRMEDAAMGYRPGNLPEEYEVVGERTSN